MNYVAMLNVVGGGLIIGAFFSYWSLKSKQAAICFALSILCFALAAGLGVK